MRLISWRNFIGGIVIYALLFYVVFMALNIIPNTLSLATDSLPESSFHTRYVSLGAISFGLSLLGWILWEVLARRFFVKNLLSCRFHMNTVWWVYVLALFVITVLLSIPIYGLISFSSNYGPSILSVLFYPFCAIVGFWAATAFCSPSPFKYAPPLSRFTRKISDRFLSERLVRSEL